MSPACLVAPLPQLQNGHQHAKGHGQYGGEYNPVVDRKQKADRIDWNPEQRDGAEEGEIHQFAPVHGIYSLTNRDILVFRIAQVGIIAAHPDKRRMQGAEKDVVGTAGKKSQSQGASCKWKEAGIHSGLRAVAEYAKRQSYEQPAEAPAPRLEQGGPVEDPGTTQDPHREQFASRGINGKLDKACKIGKVFIKPTEQIRLHKHDCDDCQRDIKQDPRGITAFYKYLHAISALIYNKMEGVVQSGSCIIFCTLKNNKIIRKILVYKRNGKIGILILLKESQSQFCWWRLGNIALSARDCGLPSCCKCC